MPAAELCGLYAPSGVVVKLKYHIQIFTVQTVSKWINWLDEAVSAKVVNSFRNNQLSTGYTRC
jgi:hypothetical protein